MNDWLTTSVVEDIHHVINSGLLVEDAVGRLRGATLPGILEYGCLRWAFQEACLPPLPLTIASSPLGTALASVASALGMSSDAPARQPLRRVDLQPAEFFLLRGEEQLTGEAWDHFQIRFSRSAQSVGLPKSVASSLHGAMHEMAENAILHACSPIPAVAGYRVMQGVAQFCVTDVGIGVLQSLKSCADFRHLNLHTEAIQEALRDGVSRYGRNKGGLGFKAVFKALAANWGHLRFRSGSGCIAMDGSSLDADRGTVQFPPFLPGFNVTVSCQTGDNAPLEPLA